MSEAAQRGKSSASRRYGPGRLCHSVESTIRRSVTPTSCSSCGACQGGSPRQRRKTGRSAITSGSTMLAGAAARRPSNVSSTTSVTIARSVPGTCQPSTRARASSRLSAASGSGKRRIVRDGCRSPIPASAARAASTQPAGTQATCVITEARMLGARAAASLRRRASAASTSARRTSRPRQLRAVSGGATTARPAAGARQRSAAPRSRRGSWGRRAGHAARPPRSRRRAATAPRPRRRA